jgi:hypothetical protein
LWLKGCIGAIAQTSGQPLAPALAATLLAAVDEIRVEFARVEPHLKDASGGKAKSTVSLMYSFPDLLMETFRDPPAHWVVPHSVVEDFKRMQVVP